MPDQLINMEDMGVIFLVTDIMGIHRESVRVELTKEDPGLVQSGPNRSVEITIPATGTVEEFAETLQKELEGMGYVATELAEGDEED
ncbi:MAG: hypothetical protein IH870_10755 [Chloroflexi bacterium]|nr:hypothetical protein [Chloroflexota bacterium]